MIRKRIPAFTCQYITRAPGRGPDEFGSSRTVAPGGIRLTAAVVKKFGVERLLIPMYCPAGSSEMSATQTATAAAAYARPDIAARPHAIRNATSSAVRSENLGTTTDLSGPWSKNAHGPRMSVRWPFTHTRVPRLSAATAPAVSSHHSAVRLRRLTASHISNAA